MRFVSKNRITYIIIVRNLNFIKEDHILKLCGISYNSSFSYDRISTDKCTMTDFCILPNDRRSINKCSWCYFCTLCDPHIFSTLLILIFTQRLSQLQNKAADLRKYFPWISHSFKNILCYCLIQCIKFFYC